MNRLLLVLSSASTAMWGQAFTDLATTTDGSTLYFASPLRQKGTDQIAQAGKIFYARDSTVSLAVQPQCSFVPQPGVSTCALQTPEVSGDGSVFAYTFSEFNYTAGLNTTQGTIALEFFERQLEGTVRLSRNGRFALSFNLPESLSPQLLDLSNNSSTPITGYSVIGDGRQAIADDGSVVLLDPLRHAVLWKAGVAAPLNLDHTAGTARMDRNARVIVYEWADSQFHLNAYDIASGIDTPLWSEGLAPGSTFGGALVAFYYQPSLSGDGRYVLIQAANANHTKDLWLIATDGSSTRQLTSGAGIAADVLSGDGVIAYASTNDNRILRVNTLTVDRTEIVGPTPVIAPAYGIVVAPGDYTAMGGGGLANTQVLVNGEPAWVIAANNGLAAFRIPWDAPVGQMVPITITSSSQFDPGSVIATVQAAVPHAWISLPIHQDFSDYVKLDSPAKPGEIVHLYVTGLGVVSPLIPLDQPASGETRVVTPLDCSTDPGGAATVLFAGEAPGQTWIYQVDVQLPSNAMTGMLTCGGASFPLAVVQ